MANQDAHTLTESARIGYYAVAGDHGRIRLLWCERRKIKAGTKPAGSWWLDTTYPATRKGERNADAALEALNCRGEIIPPHADRIVGPTLCP